MGIDVENLRQWVGREQVVEDPLCDFPARALGAMLEHDRTVSMGDALPPCWHWLYFLETPRSSMTGLDGHPRMGKFLPPIPLPRRMWAAGSLKILRLLRLGGVAQKRSRIRSIDHKTGKSGDLVFVVIEHQLSQAGQVCIQEEQTLVYRAMPTGRMASSAGEHATVAADWSSPFNPDSVALFRYSALTFNAHRIHYDRDYATQEEFYPGLVVQAPLLVTLLLDLVDREITDMSLKDLRFRAVRPAFDSSPVQLLGQRSDRHVNLWTADAENFVGISATAELGEMT
jgi:3-methylfumaryl-CoA hydratase